jgi:hypothetical protein
MNEELMDTVRTSAVGVTGSAVTGLGILPDAVSVIVGIVTIIYLFIKIGNELNEKE